jgi:hypothetical protein
VWNCFYREKSMDTEKNGIQFARLIRDTVDGSIDDINRTLGPRTNKNTFFEYIALLLWISTKEAITILPKELIQETIDRICFANFILLEESGLKNTSGFNNKIFEDFLHNRFGTYNSAWNTFAMKDEQLCKVTVIHNFIIYCLTDNEDMTEAEKEYNKLFPDPKEWVNQQKCILKHFDYFSDRAKSVFLSI